MNRLILCVSIVWLPLLAADERSVTDVREFHQRAMQGSGILVPMYVYPANIHTNSEWNRLMELKREYETVPIWVIVNPASGPGTQVDANYTKAVDRLKGAGCVVLGYVSTNYGKRPAPEVQSEIRKWRDLYPEVQGVFFDEMIYEDTELALQHQVALNRFAHHAGYWPTVGNPGTGTPGRYFQEKAADVIVIHEGSAWPSEETLHGNYFGGYSDFPPYTRCVLVHSTNQLDPAKLRMARKYARWFYVTESPFRANDPDASNPWAVLSGHLPQLCRELSKP